MSNPEAVSVDEALRMGYRWVQLGWNHRQNLPVMGSLRMMRPFCIRPIRIADLDKWQNIVEPPEPEPAGDIPMECVGR